MNLSIIIINYNSFDITCECIERVLKFTHGIEYEIILIDNNSTESDPGLFEKRFPSVRLIRARENAGFSRANNMGIRIASGDTILLLNPDAWVEDNVIGNCYGQFKRSDYVACGVQLLNTDRSFQISGSYFIKGGLNQLMALPFVGRLIRKLGYAFKIKKTNLPEAKGTVEVDWINGAFLMVKKEVIEKAGLMDEDFFLYFEEIEWCGRLRQKGRMCIYGNLNIVHLQGATTNEVFGSTGQGYYNLYDRKGLQIMLSALLRIRKQYGIGWFLFHLLAYWFTIPVFFIGVVLGLPFKNSAYSFKEFSGYATNCARVISLTRRILVNQPYFYKVL